MKSWIHKLWTPKSFTRTTQRPKKTKESWLSWIFNHSHRNLNPVKHLSGHLHSVISQEALWIIVKSYRADMSHPVLHKLVKSMPSWVNDVSKAKVGNSKCCWLVSDLLKQLYILVICNDVDQKHLFTEPGSLWVRFRSFIFDSRAHVTAAFCCPYRWPQIPLRFFPHWSASFWHTYGELD